MAKTQKENTEKKAKNASIVTTPTATRGRVFEGTVTKKFAKRVVIEAERTVYVAKFERFYKKKMRIHARIPDGFAVEVGDYIKVQECRPLSKIIHAVVVEKVRAGAHHVIIQPKAEVQENKK